MARLFLDEDVPIGLAGLLAELGHDALAVAGAGRKGLSDLRQLRFATHNGRTMVTHNARDFLQLHEACLVLARDWRVAIETLHTGILVVPQPPRVSVPMAATAITEAVSNGPWNNQMIGWHPRRGWEELRLEFETLS